MENNAPHYHVLHKRLFIENLTQFLFAFHVFRRASQNFEGKVAIVREEGLSEVGELNALGIFNVEVLNECLNLRLGVMDLHL
jgi:hypothetical protein